MAEALDLDTPPPAPRGLATAAAVQPAPWAPAPAAATAPWPGQAPQAAQAAQAATWAFMRRHPAHWMGLGFGSGLAPRAPGTVGTLWAWASFLVMDPWLSDTAWAGLLAGSALVGWWACTRTAQHLRVADPGAVVWDEVLAFWLVLWLLVPAPWWGQALAFGLFRYFDAAKPGPVGWADRRFKQRPGRGIGWREGFGILFDDLVAALCTLLVIAAAVALWRAF